MNTQELIELPVDEVALAELRTLETHDPKTPGMYLYLFHGRKSPDEEMNDFGETGPTFGPLVNVHVTYMSSIAISYGEDGLLHMHGACMGVDGVIRRDPMFIVDDLIYYDGMYYGDWSVFVEE